MAMYNNTYSTYRKLSSAAAVGSDKKHPGKAILAGIVYVS